jgi:hypothetical protein
LHEFHKPVNDHRGVIRLLPVPNGTSLPAMKGPMRITTIAIAAAVYCIMFGASAEAARCREEIGARKAAILVRRCKEVSPATHPPCNAANACALIRDEIKRSCGLLAAGRSPPPPKFCKDY